MNQPTAGPRVLLVDNYDSYTWNLYQLIWQVSGTAPVTLTNDGFTPDEVLAEDFTHLVISPGPGTPENPDDIGQVLELISRFDGPVLGVCLGHQALVAAHGGRVDRAPEPMHGRLSGVEHDGTGLFDGIPQGFQCVRYHSLAVREPLPDELVVTARAKDGVVMGLRHRDRPVHGLQFHPESIETEHGRRLIANFLALQGRNASEKRPSAWRHAERTASDDSGATPVHARQLRLEIPLDRVFSALHAQDTHAFWLDSARAAYGMGRYSYLGSVDTLRDPVLRYHAGTEELEEVSGDRVTRQHGDLFEALRKRLDAHRVDPDQFPLPFLGGLVGYLGYGVKSATGLGRLRPDPHGPDAEFLTVRRFLAADHVTGAAWLVHVGGPAAEAQEWFDGYEAQLAELSDARDEADAGQPVAGAPESVTSSVSREDYRRHLAEVHGWLSAGDSYEACYTYGIELRGPVDPAAAYLRLRQTNPAPYAAYFRSGRRSVLSASPERFLSVGADGWAETKPIKGTAARHPDPERDRHIAHRLRADEKTRSENLMIVDLLRNDLGRVCRPGTVEVTALMGVESYATVHQLVSTVRGRLQEGRDTVDCVRALFPGGSMTGAPKKRTVELLDELEPVPRGVYSGCLGFLGFNGTADLNIVIRTLICDPDATRLGTGGAITAMSDPDEEYRETVLKASALLKCLDADPGRLHSRGEDAPEREDKERTA
ncbi:aminodeoxychorismate synthase component I [Streptomyces gobiensis]|uniref:aminodeoxychorismate synthase component I n=1 Tax=Streptomyces gobiensis TaxID=2875706 RepID=UPI001E5C2DAE|nr:aminodeoxychorismate synthase component I [Streptomyces gobiensis]UGY93860.1 aminodeoxychorismate synthase component I [Streptomyces gobiensis]